MIKPQSKRILGAVLLTALFLSACMLPEKNDPFERLPKEKVETLSGEIFPFSVSVSTKATHRLEENDRLVAYLASDIVRLDDFIGRKVEVDGVRRVEKMREIFWVEAVRVKDLGEETETLTLPPRFANDNMTFPYDENWDFSTSADDVTYFTEKNDTDGRVFLQFSSETISPEDHDIDPNVLISNLAGTKEIKTDPSGRERQEISLFSNAFPDLKYKFVFTVNSDDFEKKKAFQKLLNSLVEGNENVKKIISDEKKQLADFEASRLAKEKAKKAEEEALMKAQETSEKTPNNSDDETLIGKIFGDDEAENKVNSTDIQNVYKEESNISNNEISKTETTTKVETSQPEINLNGEFNSLIDDRAYNYESTYYKFTLKVPYGFWFNNFGAEENRITIIGFAKHELETKEDADFLLEVIGDENPPTTLSEKIENGKLIITFERNDKSFFRLSGSPEFRDAMLSVQSTVQKF